MTQPLNARSPPSTPPVPQSEPRFFLAFFKPFRTTEGQGITHLRAIGGGPASGRKKRAERVQRERTQQDKHEYEHVATKLETWSGPEAFKKQVAHLANDQSAWMQKLNMRLSTLEARVTSLKAAKATADGVQAVIERNNTALQGALSSSYFSRAVPPNSAFLAALYIEMLQPVVQGGSLDLWTAQQIIDNLCRRTSIESAFQHLIDLEPGDPLFVRDDLVPFTRKIGGQIDQTALKVTRKIIEGDEDVQRNCNAAIHDQFKPTAEEPPLPQFHNYLKPFSDFAPTPPAWA
ncbi:hypothetical protein JCM10207_008872 [Rhodosporidiobolus poonsookiae]